MKVKKIAYAGLFIAMGILLPQLFHLSGLPQSGSIFLPMHIPVLFAGFILGPLYGALIGVLLPIISAILTGMPPAARLPFMIAELMTYGFFCGYLYLNRGFFRKKFGIVSTLVISMIAGRIIYAIMLFFSVFLLGMDTGGPVAAITALLMGIPGIIIQIVIIPTVIYSLKRGGFLNEFITKSEKNT